MTETLVQSPASAAHSDAPAAAAGDGQTVRGRLRSAPHRAVSVALGVVAVLVAAGLFFGGFAVGRATAPDGPAAPGFPRDGFPGRGDGPHVGS